MVTHWSLHPGEVGEVHMVFVAEECPIWCWFNHVKNLCFKIHRTSILWRIYQSKKKVIDVLFPLVYEKRGLKKAL